MSVLPARMRAGGRGVPELRERVDRARRGELLAGVLVVERVLAFERGERRGKRVDVHRRFRRQELRTCARRRRRSADSRCSGTGCRRARRRSLTRRVGRVRAAVLVAMLFVQRPQRHHEARRAEAALRAVAVDHRLLHRMQRPSRLRRSSTVKSALPSQRRHELDAGVDRLRSSTLPAVASLASSPTHDGAGAAVAFGAAFLGAGAARVLAQPVEHGAGAGASRSTSTMAPRWKKRIGSVMSRYSRMFCVRGDVLQRWFENYHRQ